MLLLRGLVYIEILIFAANPCPPVHLTETVPNAVANLIVWLIYQGWFDCDESEKKDLIAKRRLKSWLGRDPKKQI